MDKNSITEWQIKLVGLKKIKPKMYRDCGGYPTWEDRNFDKRNLYISGIKKGIEMCGKEIKEGS